MKKTLFIAFAAFLIVSCKDKSPSNTFTVKGTIVNNTAKMIYLDEIPMATMQRTTVDSAEIGKDGKFSLETNLEEARVYNLRVDNNPTPIADVINDTPEVNIDITFNPQSMYPEYEVKGSAASEQLKKFLVAFNTKMQAIYLLDIRTDSLKRAVSSDSVVVAIQTERKSVAVQTRQLVADAVSKVTNPALTMLQLGYYQSTANNPAYMLEPLTNEEVSRTINEVAAKFPSHQGIVLIKNSLDSEMNKALGWVGQTAPEFALPDVNGKTVSLSSLRGKHVLVDFWASWCGPCRVENPNVVAAYNKFKNKNFTILGVSLDRPGQKEKWIEAIKQDNLQWTHVSDLQFWSSPVVPLYRIDGIPYNVLIDPQGKIIAENLKGPALESKLAEVLGN